MSATGVSVLDDPRWTAFNRTGFACSCATHMSGWCRSTCRFRWAGLGRTEYQPDEALATLDGDFLSTHYCVSEGRPSALRVRLPLQMRGAAPAAFVHRMGTVSRADFEAYVAAKNAGTLDQHLVRHRMLGMRSPASRYGPT